MVGWVLCYGLRCCALRHRVTPPRHSPLDARLAACATTHAFELCCALRFARSARPGQWLTLCGLSCLGLSTLWQQATPPAVHGRVSMLPACKPTFLDIPVSSLFTHSVPGVKTIALVCCNMQSVLLPPTLLLLMDACLSSVLLPVPGCLCKFTYVKPLHGHSPSPCAILGYVLFVGSSISYVACSSLSFSSVSTIYVYTMYNIYIYNMQHLAKERNVISMPI